MSPAHLTNTPFKTVLSTTIVGAVALASVLSFIHGGVWAQETLTAAPSQLSLTAIPPRMGDDNSLLMQPGEKRQVTLRVINSSAETVSIQTIVQDFIVEEDGSTPVPIEVEEADNRWSLASWLTVTPGGQTIAPQQTRGINVLIEVPEDALPGGHYAMITHQPVTGGINSDEAANQQSSGVTQRVGTLLYVVVDGLINEEAFIRDFDVPQFMENGPVPFSYIVENQSDIHIRPQMGVEISNMFGKKVASIQPESKNIFPFNQRSFDGQWDRIWGFGRYKAEVVMTYGISNELAVASTYFWLIPIKLIIAIIVVLLLLILGGRSIKRQMARKQRNQSERITELETKLHELESDKLKKFEE